MPRLVFEDPSLSGPVLLDRPSISVGRDRDNDLVILHPSISRHHARIERRGAALVLLDLDSSNGLQVNGERVRQAILAPDDRVLFGDVAAIVDGSLDRTLPLRASDARDDIRTIFEDVYDVQKAIGEGSQACVFQARFLATGQDVALKVLRGKLAGSDQEARFMREIKALRRLRHASIVSFVDGGRIGPVAYLSVELLGSGTLKERLTGAGRITPRSAQRLALELSDALAHAHEEGILHRDIKPANILFRDDGNAVLADFGMAKILEASQLTTEGTSVGTPLYMSPAQLMGAPPTVLDDVYGLGATIYHAVSGHPPQPGRTLDELRALARNPQAVAARLLDLAPEVPAPFAAVIQACVSKDAASRPATARELNVRLAS